MTPVHQLWNGTTGHLVRVSLHALCETHTRVTTDSVYIALPCVCAGVRVRVCRDTCLRVESAQALDGGIHSRLSTHHCNPSQVLRPCRNARRLQTLVVLRQTSLVTAQLWKQGMRKTLRREELGRRASTGAISLGITMGLITGRSVAIMCTDVVMFSLRVRVHAPTRAHVHAY